MSKLEIFIGANHYVKSDNALISSKVKEKVGKFFLCQDDVSQKYYIISSKGNIELFPINEENKTIDVIQHFTDGVCVLEDRAPDVKKEFFFDSYELKDDVVCVNVGSQIISIKVK